MSVVEDFDCPDAGGGGLHFYFMRCLRGALKDDGILLVGTGT